MADTPGRPSATRRLEPGLAGVGLTLAYFLLALAGLRWAAVAGANPPVWPAAGVALAVLIRRGVGLWPCVLIASLGATLAAGTTLPWWAVLVLASGNAAAAGLAAQGFRRLRLDAGLARSGDVLGLILIGAVGGAAIAASVDTLTLLAAGTLARPLAGTAWLSRFLGDASGVLVVAPVLLTRAAIAGLGPRGAAAWRYPAGVATAAVVGYGVFVAGAPGTPLAWLALLPLFWAAIDFRVRGAAVVVTVVAILAVGGTTRGGGPFGLETGAGRLLHLQLFLLAGASASLLLAALAEEQRSGRASLRSEEFVRGLANVAPTILYVYDLEEGRNVWGNREIGSTLGYDRTALDAMAGDLMARLLHPEDLARYAGHAERLRGLADGEVAEFEYRMRHVDGSWRWLQSRDMVFARGADGRTRQVVGAALDITGRKADRESLVARHRHAELLSRTASRLVLRGPGALAGPADRLSADVFRELAEGLGAEFFFHYVAGPEPETLHLAASAGLDAEQAGRLACIGFGEYFCGTVARSGRPLVLGDLGASDLEGASGLKAAGAQAYAGFPLLSGATLHGTIGFATATRAAFTADEVSLMQTACDMFAAAAERDRLTKSLAANEERLRLATEAAGIGYWTWEVGTDATTRDARCAELFGVPPDAGAGLLFSRVHEEDRASFEAAIADAIEGRGPYRAEFRVRRPDGTVRWLAELGDVLRDGLGRPVRMTGVIFDATGRKEAELALRDREEQLSMAFEAAELTAFSWDIERDRVERRLSRVAALPTTNGVCRGPTTFSGVVEVVHPQDREAFESGVRAALRGGDGRYQNSYRVVDPGGATTWVEEVGRVAFGEDGSPRHLFGVAADVTERRAAERRLQESEARLRLALEATDTGLWTWDVATDAVTWSPECYRIYGREPGDFGGTGAAFFATVHPEDRPRVEATVRGAIAEHARYECEFRILVPDGQARWVSNRGRASYDAGGRPVRVVGTITDIDARLRAEAAGREGEALYRALAAHLPGGAAFVVDQDLRYRLADGEAIRLWGLTPEQFEGRTLREALPADLADLHEPDYRAALRGIPFRREHESHGRHYISHGVPLRLEGGEVHAVLAISYDITDRKAAEEALRRSEDGYRMALSSARMDAFEWDPVTDQVRRSLDKSLLLGEDASWLGSTGREYFERVHPDDRTALEAALRALTPRRPDFSADYRMVLPSGRVVWLRDAAAGEFAADGRLARVRGVTSNVTELRRAQLAIEESESFYRRTLESIPGMVFTNTPDGACDYVSEQWVAYTGVAAADQLGEGWGQVLHPDDRSRAAAAWRAAVAGRGEYDLEYRVRRHDGQCGWFKVRGRAIVDGSGAVARWLGTAVDIDDLKQTEEALRASEARLRAAFDAMAEGVVRRDAAGRVVEGNPMAAEILGLPAADLPGMDLTAFRCTREDGEPWPAGEHPIGATPPAGSPVRDRVLGLVRPDGGLRWLLVNTAPLEGDGGAIVTFADITDRKRAEAELAARETRYRLVADAANDAIWDWDLEADQIVWNEGVQTLFGHAPEAVGPDGAWWVEQIHPEDRARVVAGIHQQIDRGPDEWHDEYRFRRGDGTYALISDRGKVVRDPGGRPVRMVGSMLDLTGRRAAEAALRAAEERFAFVRASSGVGFWYCDLPFDVLEWDEQVKAHFFLPPDAPVTIATFYDRIHPDDREPTRLAIQRSVEGRQPYDVVYRTVDPAGAAERYVRAIGRTTYDPGGAPARFDGVTVDVTELKRAEVALRRRERELQTLADNTPDLLSRLDRDLRHVFVNAAFAAVTGHELDPSPGRTSRELGLPGGVCDAWDAAILGVFADGRPRSIALTFPSDQGPRQFAWRLVPELGEAGKVEYVLSVGHDVTERVRFEDTLREQDRRKDEFLATLAHELRNPLAPIRSGLQLLGMPAPAEELEATRAMMERQLNHLVRLVDDLLDVSRISRGKIELKRERVPLAAVLESAVESSRPPIAAGGHDLAITQTGGPAWLDADATRLAQVVGNLLNNAAKYTPPGGRIRLEAEAAGPQAVIRVRDDGMGIPADMLPRVFDLFTQVDLTLDRAQGGLGIGLSLVRTLVEMHGGTVDAESAGPGLGSTFTVRLPTAPPPAAAGLAAGAASSPARSPAAAAGAPLRVLIVDDNADAASTLARLVRRHGHEAAVAGDGVEALAAVAASRPDVVFLDIGLPGLDGYEVCRALRARPGLPPMTIVALTGWGAEADRRRTAEAGFDAHLVKPVELGAILDVLGRASEHARPDDAAGSAAPESGTVSRPPRG